jgi:hypothetical protein
LSFDARLLPALVETDSTARQRRTEKVKQWTIQ